MKKFNRLFGISVTLILLAVFSNAQSVKINEVYSRGVAGDLDWIEIYNMTGQQIDLAGYKIYDSGAKTGVKGKKYFPAGAVLPAFGNYAIVVDTATFVGDTTGFGLSSTGETVWLENPAGVIIDTLAFPVMGTDTSYARVPDGYGVWTLTTPRTKGKSNVFIKMNEIYSRGVAGALDWIEIHNSSAAAINISGYKIYDSGAKTGVKGKKIFPAGTIVPANGFSLIVVDTATFVGDTTGFGLSSTGETVWLENAAGLLIDTVAIPALGNDTSYARVPDGSNVMMKRAPVTKGTTNGILVTVHPEVRVARGYGLEQNYPNPFNPSTTITYRLAMNSFVKIAVYDVVGNEVALLVNGQQSSGDHTVQFSANRFASGVYFYRLMTGTYSEMKKMVLIK
jgi:predicted extracellular nuclease